MYKTSGAAHRCSVSCKPSLSTLARKREESRLTLTVQSGWFPCIPSVTHGELSARQSLGGHWVENNGGAVSMVPARNNSLS